MSRMGELKRCGEILIGVSESLTELFSGSRDEETQPEKKTVKKAADKEPQKGEANHAGGSSCGVGREIAKRPHGSSQGSAAETRRG